MQPLPQHGQGQKCREHPDFSCGAGFIFGDGGSWRKGLNGISGQNCPQCWQTEGWTSPRGPLWAADRGNVLATKSKSKGQGSRLYGAKSVLNCMLPSWATLINATPPGRSTTACTVPALSPSPMTLWKAVRSTTNTTIQRLTSGTRGAPWTPSTSGPPRRRTASSLRSPRMCRTRMEPWSSMLCSSSVSVIYSPPDVLEDSAQILLSLLLLSTAHWDEKFHDKMVDNRAFLVSRSHTIGISMMHRTGQSLNLSSIFELIGS